MVKTIKADQILVYVKQAASKTPASQIQFYKEAIKKGQVLTEKDVVVEKKEFDYLPLIGQSYRRLRWVCTW